MAFFPRLAPGQRCQIFVGGVGVTQPELLFETAEIQLEAPNWSLDGSRLLLNGDGILWSLDVADPGAGVTPIAHDGLPELNNDHVLDPDGEHIYLSAMDQHIYRASLAGGPVTRVSPDDGSWHFLHGVSPDGTRLAYVEITEFGQPGRLVVSSVATAETLRIDSGDGHLDGPEWSPDGAWIYVNTESFTTADGHAQLARIPDAGGAAERLLASDRVDWFPHLAPDGRHATYLSFPPGTLGHPADREVEVRVVSVDDWSTPLQSYALFGGQGTLNVNSWSPGGERFAFVAYPIG